MFLNHVFDKPDRLLEHRLSQIVGESREALAIHGIVRFKMARIEPVRRELSGQAARARVFQHSASLGNQHVAPCQVARGGMVQQLLIGHAGPQKIAEPAREVVSRERDCRVRRRQTLGRPWPDPADRRDRGIPEKSGYWRPNRASHPHATGHPASGASGNTPASHRAPPWSTAGDRRAPQTSPALPTEPVQRRRASSRATEASSQCDRNG